MSKNESGKTNTARRDMTGAVAESEDDEPGIRGLTSSFSNILPPPSSPASQITEPLADPLDAAIIEYSYVSPGSAALKLDQFVLGRTEIAQDVAQGSLFTPGSALHSLKGVVASTDRSLQIQDRQQVEWSSSSSSSSASSSASSSPASDSLASNSSSPKKPVESVGMAVKRMIKQICVAGLDRSRSNRKFCLDIDEIRQICSAVQEQFLSEPSLLRLEAPVKVVGDIHGQFRDLMRLFKKGGMPPSQNYLFLGDYVDRGKQSMETVLLLFLLKLRYPKHVHLLRGNHECAGVTKVYGFYDECKRRSSLKAWRAVVDVFNTLPVAALVGERIFCVHGGISPSLTSFAQIEQVKRPTDVPDTGLVTDLLWSDPDPQVKEWADNDRGVSFCFGQRSLERFCKQLNVDLVVRGHMVVEDGYEFFAGRRLVTVFSAPDYCGDFDNYGAMMNITKELVCSFDVIEPRRPRKLPPVQREAYTVDTVSA